MRDKTAGTGRSPAAPLALTNRRAVTTRAVDFRQLIARPTRSHEAKSKSQIWKRSTVKNEEWLDRFMLSSSSIAA